MSKIDTGPAQGLVAITPNDSTNLATPIRGFHVGVSGNVSLIDLQGTTVTVTGCLAGMYYPYPAVRIRATNTTATSLLGIY